MTEGDGRNAQPAVPTNTEAEQAVLGAIFIDQSVITRLLPIIQPEHFWQERHAVIWRAVKTLYERNDPVDYLTLIDQLERDGTITLAGGFSYLTELMMVTPTAVHAEAHARLVTDAALRRGIISAGGRIAAAAYGNRHETDDLVELAQREIARAVSTRVTSSLKTMPDALNEFLESLQPEAPKSAVSTGFMALDEKLNGGMHRSDLILLAGRPAMGKTGLALNIATHVGVKLGLPVLIFTLEMRARQLVARMLAAESGIETKRMPTMDEIDERKFGQTLVRLADANITMDETSSSTAMTIRARAQQLHDQHPLGLVVIDHIQIMGGIGRQENRTQEISEISRQLKALARDLDVPVLALSQLNRGVENRADKRPKMSDLQLSGALEQDADVVLMMYRDAYYNQDSERAGIAEVLIEKHRNGATGTVELAFNERTTKFMSL